MPDLVSYLSYPDAPAVVDWLTGLGFSVVRRVDDAGRIVHCELRRGEAVVMLASDDADYTVPPLQGVSTGAGVYLVVAVSEVDELFRAAVDGGGRAVYPPEDTPWSGRRARVLDPGGREWTFGSYRPGEE